jgi:hypothetical protein
MSKIITAGDTKDDKEPKPPLTETPVAPDLERQMRLAEHVMHEDQEILRALAQ